MKYLVNVDSGVEIGEARFALGTVVELDEKDGRVQELVKSGRLIPVELKKETEAKKPDAKPEPEN